MTLARFHGWVTRSGVPWPTASSDYRHIHPGIRSLMGCKALSCPVALHSTLYQSSTVAVLLFDFAKR